MTRKICGKKKNSFYFFREGGRGEKGRRPLYKETLRHQDPN